MFKTFYRRKLPHIIPAQGLYVCILRLHGMLEESQAQLFKEENEYFRSLKNNLTPSQYRLVQLRKAMLTSRLVDQKGLFYANLLDEKLTHLVINSLKFYDEEIYNLVSYEITNGHLKVILKLTNNAPELYKVMQRLKSWTGRQGNQIIKREGQFWDRETFDFLISTQQELELVKSYMFGDKMEKISDKIFHGSICWSRANQINTDHNGFSIGFDIGPEKLTYRKPEKFIDLLEWNEQLKKAFLKLNQTTIKGLEKIRKKWITVINKLFFLLVINLIVSTTLNGNEHEIYESLSRNKEQRYCENRLLNLEFRHNKSIKFLKNEIAKDGKKEADNLRDTKIIQLVTPKLLLRYNYFRQVAVQLWPNLRTIKSERHFQKRIQSKPVQ